MCLKSYKKRGVSIMEILTAVIIISILSSTAYVGWRRYIRKAITAEAKVNLSMFFASQSTYRATCNTYHPDLRTIGALPKGKLHYNIGGKADPAVTNWGHCLTEQDALCSSCVTYFDEVCCNNQTDYEDVSHDCPCFIRSKYKLDKNTMSNSSQHQPSVYCGTAFTNGSILENKFCVLAATAMNRDTNDAEWDVWAVNHLNVIKQVYYPED